MAKKIMVFAPHADDTELGIGGYVAREVSRGAEVVVVVATVGPINFLHLGRVVSTQERLDELHKAMSVLGVSKVHVLVEDYDSRLHLYPQGDMVAALDALQAAFQPDEVLIPLPSAHQDHRYCWEVGVAATRPSPSKDFLRLVAAYEYPLSSWGEGSHANSFQGGLYLDVTEYMDTKLKALSQYSTQMRGGNALISEDAARALCRLRGIESGFEYAELLHILRMRSV